MKATLGGCIALALLLSHVPGSLPGDAVAPHKVIFEDDARMISARLYSAILINACRGGWRYPLSRVKRGFKRHFDEFKLQLASSGYTIVPGRASTGARKQQRASAAIRNDRVERRFGCSRKYWLDE